MSIITFALLVAAITASNLLAQWLQIFYMTHRRERCGECGKKTRPVAVSFPCENCIKKMRESRSDGLSDITLPLSHSDYVQPIINDDIIIAVKKMYSDPEFMKSVRKGLGLQSEREQFEEEASE